MKPQRILLVGDTNVRAAERNGMPFADVADLLDGGDAIIGHMEGLVGTGELSFKKSWTHSDEASVAAYADAGFSALCCASNVSYGTDAVRTTVEVLERHRLSFAGIGLDREEAHRPALIEALGMRTALFSRTSVFQPVGHAATDDGPGTATMPAYTAYRPPPRALEMPGASPIVLTWPDEEALAELCARIAAARRKADLVIASFHWGVSDSRHVHDYQRTIARRVIESGADVVFGHHPHVVQPVEVWRGRPIFYSLGNFAFDWERMAARHRTGMVVELEVRTAGGDVHLDAVRLVPVCRNDQNQIVAVSIDDPAVADDVKIVTQRQDDGIAAEGAETRRHLTLSMDC